MLSASVLTACSDDEFSGDPVKDWNGTSTFFAPTDAQGFGTFYKPAVGRVGDPMPFFDQKTGDFKVLYPSPQQSICVAPMSVGSLRIAESRQNCV